MIELVHPLSWDSNFFKRKVGYSNIFNLKDLPKVYAEAASSNYTLLYIYSGIHIKEFHCHNPIPLGCVLLLHFLSLFSIALVANCKIWFEALAYRVGWFFKSLVGP